MGRTNTCDALENEAANYQCINVGSGEGVSVIRVAETLKRLYASDSEIKISGDFRKGDIRHNIADIRRARELCGFEPAYTFEKGMEEFAEWVKQQEAENDLQKDDGRFERSLEEMKATGMLIQGEK